MDTATATTKLAAMLSYRRPAYGRSERQFIERFIAPTGAKPDAAGNWIMRVGTSRVLWSSHTDTVHRLDARQRVAFDNVTGLLRLAASTKRPECLGADCTAGVWLMLELIEAGVPGLYVFHAAEEIGGRGSHYIATATPDLLAGIHFAIAFDRRGTRSIITEQAGERCCSDAFAYALADMLGMRHEPDAWGIFTDTANYTDLVPECTNVSVGFNAEHSKRETLDVGYLVALRDALVARFREDALPAERNPAVIEYGFELRGAPGDWLDDLPDAPPRTSVGDAEFRILLIDARQAMRRGKLDEWMWCNTDVASEFLADAYGEDPEHWEDMIYVKPASVLLALEGLLERGTGIN